MASIRMPSALAAAALILTGCSAPEPAEGPPPERARPPAEPTTPISAPPAPANATAEPAAANSSATNRTWPPQEHDLHITVWADVGVADSGNMRDTMWQVEVPEGAVLVRAMANVTSPMSTTFGDSQPQLMLHAGTVDNPAPSFASAEGFDVVVEWVAMPPETSSLVLMYHVPGDPVVNGPMDVHLTVWFGA